MQDYFARFRGQSCKQIAGRLGVTAATVVGGSVVLLGITAVTLTLCAILLGFALIIPELIAAAACIVAILIQPKTDFTVGLLPPLIVFFIYWVWFAVHFFHL